MDLDGLRALVREIPDFPRQGIGFKDITPLLANADALSYAVARLAELAGRLGQARDRGVERGRVEQQRREILEHDPGLREVGDLADERAEVHRHSGRLARRH